MSVDMIRDAQIPSMKGNMSMEYEPKDYSGYGPHNTMLSKAYGDGYGKLIIESNCLGDISMQQERIKRATRGYTNLNESITGIKTASELKPALQVKQNSRLMGKGSFRGASALPKQLPPVKGTSKKLLDITHSPGKNSSMMQEQTGYEEYKYSTASFIPSKSTKLNLFSEQ